jgi:hypothetical protein
MAISTRTAVGKLKHGGSAKNFDPAALNQLHTGNNIKNLRRCPLLDQEGHPLLYCVADALAIRFVKRDIRSHLPRMFS